MFLDVHFLADQMHLAVVDGLPGCFSLVGRPGGAHRGDNRRALTFDDGRIEEALVETGSLAGLLNQRAVVS